jgi:hypothetical protein
MGRILKVGGATVGLLVYVWVAAVKNADLVKKRKRARRTFDERRSVH